MSDKDRDGLGSVGGEPSRRVRVHQMDHEWKEVGVVVEYENEEEALKHIPNLGRREAVLVRKKGEQPKRVPIQD